MTKLLALWAAWRLLRALVAIAAVAALTLLLLGGGVSRTTRQSRNAIGQLKHAARPLEQQLQRTLQEAFKP